LDIEKRIKDIPMFNDRVIKEPNWIIPGLIVESHFHLLAGAPGTMKSTFALWISKVAIGLGFDVVYIDLENSDQLVKGRWDWLQLEQGEGLTYWNDSISIPIELRPPAELSEEMYMPLARPKRLMIFDSLTRFHGEDENTISAMAPVMHFFRRCVNRGATVLVLHHSGKRHEGRDASVRGSSDFSAAPDIVHAIVKFSDQPVPVLTIQAKKNRFSICGREKWYLDMVGGEFVGGDNWEPILVRNVIGDNGDLGQGDLVAVLQGHGLTKKRALELLDEVPSRVGKRGKREYFL